MSNNCSICDALLTIDGDTKICKEEQFSHYRRIHFYNGPILYAEHFYIDKYYIYVKKQKHNEDMSCQIYQYTNNTFGKCVLKIDNMPFIDVKKLILKIDIFVNLS